MVLNVRALEIKDIPLIADYWLTSTPDFLKGMGVDLSKVPPRESLSLMLTEQLALPIQKGHPMPYFGNVMVLQLVTQM